MSIFLRQNILILFFLSNVCVTSQTLVINEISQGPSGSKEYVEFLVIPTGPNNPCQQNANCLDLRGWIFDDNNTYFTPGSTSGVGLAQGSLRFSNSAFWSCIPVGTLIVVFNDMDINASIPANDFSMNDGNCRLIIPASSGLIEGNANNPSAAAPLTYPIVGWTAGGLWSYTGMANTGDSYQVYAPVNTSIPAHAISWGNNSSNNIIYFAGPSTALVFYFNSFSNNPYAQNNWSSASSPLFETPGSGNNAANSAYIQSLTNNCTPIIPLTANPTAQNTMCICNGSVTASPSGGNGVYSYVWTNAQGQPVGNSATVSNLCAGWYYVQVGSGGCINNDSIQVINAGALINPTFSNFGPYCQGAIPAVLPNTSNNGITGTWSPPSISTVNSGSAVYTFTPDAGQCANATTQTVVVNGNIMPTFNAYGPYCPSAQLPTLPNTSLNGISGSWNPGIINSTLGSTTYTFTPAAGQCGSTESLTITIISSVTPTFLNLGPYCQNTLVAPLPSTSNNGISGSWNPPSVNANIQGSGTYIFTPDAGQCGDTIVQQIQISAQLSPTFTNFGPYCLGDFAALPNTSTNGISGTWNPSNINTSQAGTSTYTFNPTPGNCAIDTVISVLVANPLINAGNDTTICAGNYITLEGSGGNNYLWNNGILDGIPFTPNTTSTYTVCGTVGSCIGCDTVLVTVNPSPSASFISDISGYDVQFLYMGTPVQSFNWNFGDGDNSSLMDPNHTYTSPGIYGVLLIVNDNGCTSTYFAEIELFAPGTDVHLINIITPNGDGVNDVFDLNLNGYKKVTIQIVNRWGNLMAELTGSQLTWDGKTNGHMALEGVYFYKYETLGYDGKTSTGHGFFHLK